MAQSAADLDHRAGRAWRNLQDPADGVPSMQNAPHAWEDYRRGLDYYDEDVLTWLWADVIIRQQSKGAKSLDDFCKLFYGGPSGPPMVKTYTFDDVVNALNQVASYDWLRFWTDLLSYHGPGGPIGGGLGIGREMAYDEAPSGLDRANDWRGKAIY